MDIIKNIYVQLKEILVNLILFFELRLDIFCAP